MSLEPRAANRGRPMLTARLLGRLTLALDGQLVDTQSSRRMRNVLAYLLTHRRRPVARDVLMEVFWPHATPAAARNSLHVALTAVRNALRDLCPEPVLERRFDTYAIADSVAVWVDVEEFESRARAGSQAERIGDSGEAIRCYEAANQLYDGDFLADDPYAEWATATRERLRLLALDVQCRLVDLYAERRDYAAAVQLGRWIVAYDACNEGVHRRLMSCYAEIGQSHLALVQYHRCVDALRHAFGVRPSAETSTLYERLRDPASRLRCSA